MKIAILHNFMDNIGGAERVGLTLARALDADYYSTNIDKEKIKKMGFEDLKLYSISKIPVNPPFRQQVAFSKFRKLNLKDKYDFYIIAGDWAMPAVVNNKPNLWYVHSPIREIWDLYEYTRNKTVPFIFRIIFDVWVKYNRFLSRKYIKHVNKIVCNSINTKKRVEKYFNRKAIVIYPPIETSKFYYKENGDFWLSVNRLITHKRVDLQIKTFAKMPEEKLVIVGSYEQSKHFKKYANYIKKIKSDNVQILSWIDFNELVELYAKCRGFISTAKNEDFGMTVVEAMASGKPVIASNEGGHKETIIDGVTGRLIDDINEEKLIKIIKEVGAEPEKYKNACIEQAKNFDTTIFLEKIINEINNARK